MTSATMIKAVRINPVFGFKINKTAARGSRNVRESQNNIDAKLALYFSDKKPFPIAQATCVDVPISIAIL